MKNFKIIITVLSLFTLAACGRSEETQNATTPAQEDTKNFNLGNGR